MINYLDFKIECPPEFLPRIGGQSCIPQEIDWPKSKDGNPMLHFMAIPTEIVNEHLGFELPEKHCISLFIPYQPDSIQHVIDLARNNNVASIFMHPISKELRQECSFPLNPAHAIRIDCDHDAEEEDEFSDEIDSKIGGTPVWLQDRISIDHHHFLLQFVGSVFDKYWPSHKGLFMGGIGYVFINTEHLSPGKNLGQLKIQFT
ncbi:DUF1963 domain-containing protein [Chitinilyticum litopenaei]|uniref:DUF1963 domain-containing protein n=1 Tax=Chitinilyticum litopenaei TaxID=1121276 RepID=UPI0009DBC195|nr:DUF1963 domain-containing protein [Chitinilyticum litopenaei]